MGSYCTVIVAVCPGLKVTGMVPCVKLKSAPVTDAALTVTGAVPVELRVTVCVTGAFSDTLPKATLETLMLSVKTGSSDCAEKVPMIAGSVDRSAASATHPKRARQSAKQNAKTRRVQKDR